MRSIESDQVATKCGLARRGYHMDGKDCTLETSERAIICHTNPATYWQYVPLQDMLTSAEFYKADSWARACNGPCPAIHPQP
jgi:hypothetical protein